MGSVEHRCSSRCKCMCWYNTVYTVLSLYPANCPANQICTPSHGVYADYLLPVFCYLLSVTYFPVTKLPVPNRTSNRSHQVLLASSLLLSSKWWLLLPNPPPAKQKCWSIINDIPRWVGKEKKTMTEKRKDELLTFWLLDFWSLSLSTHLFLFFFK